MLKEIFQPQCQITTEHIQKVPKGTKKRRYRGGHEVGLLQNSERNCYVFETSKRGRIKTI